MGKSDRISGTFWFFFSLFISYESYKLGLGTINQPGPGFLFFWTGIVVALLALVIIAKALKRPAEREPAEQAPEKRNITKVALVLASLFAYAAVMEKLGFFISTLLLFVFLLGFIERKRWWVVIVVSFVVTLCSYLIFETGLQSQLPKGILESLRF